MYKVCISHRCIRALMPNLIKKSRTVSNQGCNQLLGIITRSAAWLQTAMLCWHKNWCMTPLTSWNFPESHWSCATKTSQTCHCCSQKVVFLQKYSFILVFVKIYRKRSNNLKWPLGLPWKFPKSHSRFWKTNKLVAFVIVAMHIKEIVKGLYFNCLLTS